MNHISLEPLITMIKTIMPILIIFIILAVILSPNKKEVQKEKK